MPDFIGYSSIIVITHLPLKKRTLLENVYGGKETWQVQVWEYAEGYLPQTGGPHYQRTTRKYWV